uniref:Uncharacterized protein n=1 Tax=Romanomermis culicivorax TaxID=13658 RepID=A0A915L911_ROMCU
MTYESLGSGADTAIRKLFACELRYLNYNSAIGKWEIKVNGRDLPVNIVWLQGSFIVEFNQNQSDSSTNLRRFSDSTGFIDVLIPAMDEIVTDKIYQLLAQIENIKSGSVVLKSRKLATLSGSKDFLDDLWLAEVIEYHDFMLGDSAR